MNINPQSFKELDPRGSAQAIRKDNAQYSQCVKDLNQAGRYCIDEVVQGWGYARVVQALAARIVAEPHEYDLPVVALARQIPIPRHKSGYVNYHRAFVQAEFVRLTKMHLT